MDQKIPTMVLDEILTTISWQWKNHRSWTGVRYLGGNNFSLNNVKEIEEYEKKIEELNNTNQKLNVKIEKLNLEI